MTDECGWSETTSPASRALTLDNPERRNAYDPAMREQLGGFLDELAYDDAIKVVILRGEGGVFSTGADMNNAYAWYGDGTKPEASGSGNGTEAAPRNRRPSQRRRLLTDRKTFDFYHFFLGYPKATVAEVSGLALGGGFELALMADISVVGSDCQVGMPATRFLGPALGSLHMFFYRLGPVLARRLLLTGDTIDAAELAGRGRLHRGRGARRGRVRGRPGGPRRWRGCRQTGSSWPRRPSG